MPIYDQTFRRYEGPRRSHYPWWPVTWHTLRRVLRAKLTYAVLLVALANLIIYSIGFFMAAQIYQHMGDKAKAVEEAVQMSEIPLFGKNKTIGTVFFQFLMGEFLFLWLLVLVTGGGIISSDKRFNALPLYFSRPLSVRSYMVGKILGLAVFPAAVLVSSVLLLYMQAGAYFYTTRELIAMLPVVFYALVYVFAICLVTSTSMAAFSSLTTNARVAAVVYLGFWAGTSAIGAILNHWPGAQNLAAISPGRSLQVIGRSILRPELANTRQFRADIASFSLSWAIVAVILYVIVFLWLFYRNLRVVEVVK